ncbi:hypothetical protein HIM_10395 [Hirsutella minnesotensis 3608]|uniref:Uncharacterized protein n=1 Tax=Hirsutella minnesotensis 3608 TaxID=1043627 RepID=A0A0F8A2C7_9HYPO|nr:hypothetical protein HIM_10395 [Hirsutella minnesotensis 3608]
MSYDSAENIAARLLNKEKVIRSLNEKIPEYSEHVAEELRSTIRNETTANLLEIQVFKFNDTEMESPLWTERPPVNPDWVAAFYKWTKGRTLNGCKLRAGIERISVKACVDASVSYFTSEEHIQIVGQGLINDLKVNKAVQSIVVEQLKGTGKLTKREIEDLMKIHGGHTVAQHTHDVISANMHLLLDTKMGIVLAHMLGAALAMPVVKIAIMKALMVALSHAAIQHLLIVAAKHAGIAVIAVIFFGSAGATVLSWMLLPMIAGILAYQYVTMPKTLAREITPKVVAAISQEAPTINESVTVAVAEALLKEFFKLSKGTIEKLHDKAMDYWDAQN